MPAHPAFRGPAGAREVRAAAQRAVGTWLAVGWHRVAPMLRAGTPATRPVKRPAIAPNVAPERAVRTAAWRRARMGAGRWCRRAPGSYRSASTVPVRRANREPVRVSTMRTPKCVTRTGTGSPRPPVQWTLPCVVGASVSCVNRVRRAARETLRSGAQTMEARGFRAPRVRARRPRASRRRGAAVAAPKANVSAAGPRRSTAMRKVSGPIRVPAAARIRAAWRASVSNAIRGRVTAGAVRARTRLRSALRKAAIRMKRRALERRPCAGPRRGVAPAWTTARAACRTHRNIA